MFVPLVTPFAVTWAPIKKVKIKLNNTVKQQVINEEMLNPICKAPVLDFGKSKPGKTLDSTFFVLLSVDVKSAPQYTQNLLSAELVLPHCLQIVLLTKRLPQLEQKIESSALSVPHF